MSDSRTLPDPQPFDLGWFLPAQLATLSRLTQAMLATALEGEGLTIPHWRVLLCLQRGPGTLGEVVAFTRLPQSTLSRAIARMEERGLVAITREAEDRRRARIEITADGRDRLAAAAATVTRHTDDVLRLDTGEREQFGRTVAYLIRHLSARDL